MAGGYRDWQGHVIVCGLRRVGLRIIEELTLSGVMAVVIEESPDPVAARIVKGQGVPLVVGSSRAAETLTESGLAGALAVICVQDDDLHALETALLTRRLREDVRVVAQVANPAVGRALSQVGVSVLDVAGLSAPSIVEACLCVGVQDMTLSGERFLAVRVTVAKRASLRELYGPLAPIAVVPAADGEVAICPGRDALVGAGDQVTLVGTPAELRAAGVSDHAERTVLTARSNRSGRAGYPLRAYRLLLSLLQATDRKLMIALGTLLTVLVGATAVLRLTYVEAGTRHNSLLDATYFAVETVTTVGYGDYSFRGQSPWLIAFAIVLMLAGALFVAVFFALVTNVLVSRRIEEALGRQRITALNGHVLVVGLGTIGLRVVQQLAAAGSDVVVVEKNEHNRHLGQVRALGVPVVIADATLPEVLRSVRLTTAAAVAVLTSDDLVNLETGLAVRDQLGARRESTPIVLRIFDPQLARSVQETFGFTDVRSTAALAAPWFVGAALGLDVLSTFYAAGVPLLVARLTVSPGGGLHGLTMLDLAARSRVLAIRRVADPMVLEHPLRRDTRFGAADEAYLIGPYSELLSVLRRDRPSPQSPSLPRTTRLRAEPSLPFGLRNLTHSFRCGLARGHNGIARSGRADVKSSEARGGAALGAFWPAVSWCLRGWYRRDNRYSHRVQAVRPWHAWPRAGAGPGPVRGGLSQRRRGERGPGAARRAGGFRCAAGGQRGTGERGGSGRQDRPSRRRAGPDQSRGNARRADHGRHLRKAEIRSLHRRDP